MYKLINLTNDVGMPDHLGFRRQAFLSLLDGVSALDIPQLARGTPEAAREFIKSYGYDLSVDSDRREAEKIHQKAILLMREQFLNEGEEIPFELHDPASLKDISQIILYASQNENKDLQRWSCALLKVMHVMVHFENDLYSIFTHQIQKQILDPISSCIYDDPVKAEQTLQMGDDKIRLHKFEKKTKKDFTSAVLKLLAKKNLVALNIYDKIGVRFITKSTFDTFRVIRFLIDHSFISFPHSIANESINTVYPTNLFFEVVDELKVLRHGEEIPDLDAVLKKKIEEHIDRAEWRTKDSPFTDKDYRFIKFINRKLIRVNVDENGSSREYKFFFPFEVQVMDYQTYLSNMRGPLSHNEYKERQRQAAKRRLFPHGI